MKSQGQRKIEKFLNNLERNTNSFPEGYLEVHKDKIEWLHWLIASYEGRAGDPKELLEALINLSLNNYYEYYANEMKAHDIEPIMEIDKLKNLISHINFLYNWVYYKKIVGF
jgi:hypothetical protein